ncbi:MAG: RagB/SusD family nutrient uptake outer membrane protein [Parafilimonas sp.]
MRNYKYFLPLLFFVACFACNKKLDVQPQNNVTDIQTGDDVTALLFGGYSLLQNASGFGEQYIFIPDLLANTDQVLFVGTFTDYKDLANKKQTKESAIASGIWENSYLLIQNMNTVLDKISLVDADAQDEVSAEAKFMRGVAYYELVNFFAQPYSAGNTTANPGVPLVLQPTYLYDSTKNKPARASVEDVYKQIIADLTDAANGLPASADNARATKFSAEAFLARTYLNMGDYTNAAAMANDVINSSNFTLTSTYNQAFNNPSNSTEDVFGIQQTAQSNAGTADNGIVTFYRYAFDADGNNQGGRGDAQVDPKYFTHFDDANDLRQSYTTQGSSISGVDGTYALKWLTFYRVVPVVRLAEMYLTRGEANLQKGGSPAGGVMPLDDINKIRERANAADLLSVDDDDFVAERFREMGFEGDRLWTLKRLKLDVGKYHYNDAKLVLPIPQREIDVNSNLTQNPGY